jgi:DNA invertase Pin-like site-specific DNA recombinase
MGHFVEADSQGGVVEGWRYPGDRYWRFYCADSGVLSLQSPADKAGGHMIAVYLRVSTNDQENGIASQEAAIASYLAGQGIEEATYYRDRLSGKDLNRPAFEAMQKAIAAGEVRTIIVWKLDRISRNLRDGVNVLTDWLDKNVRVVAIAQQIDFSGAIGKMLAAVLLGLAELERDNLRENTRRGLNAARERGVKLGKPIRIDAASVCELRATGLSTVDIATRLNCSPSGVRQAIARGHRQVLAK